MPRRYPITEKELSRMRELEKDPFITSIEIARRLRISTQTVARYAKPRTQIGQRNIIRDLLKKYGSNPQQRSKLNHPKLWIPAQLQRLAPTHTTPEILTILQKMKREGKVPKGIILPTITQLRSTITRFSFRTPEQMRVIRQRITQKRTPNSLTRDERERLILIAQPFVARIENQLKRYYGDKIIPHIQDYIERETRFVRTNTGASDNELFGRWFTFLKNGRKFIILNAVRSLRSQQRREGPRARMIIEETTPSQPSTRQQLDEMPDIAEALASLTGRDKNIAQKLALGEKPRQIAQEYGLAPQSIYHARGRIGKKLQIAKRRRQKAQ